MTNFLRLVRLALRQKTTFFASIVCSLMVALLWGANIGTVYPFVEVVFQGKSLPQWTENQLHETQQTINKLKQELGSLEKKVAQADTDEQKKELTRSLGEKRSRLQAEQYTRNLTAYVAPYIHKYIPSDPFQTLLLIVGFLLVGTLLKDLFLVLHIIFVERISQRTTLQLRQMMYEHTLKMDLADWNTDNHAKLLSHFTYDVESIHGGLNNLFGRAIREPLKMVACLAGAAFICWRLLVLSLVVTPVAFFLVRWLAKSIKRANRRAMEEMSLLYNRLSETFAGIKIIKSFTSEAFEQERYNHLTTQYFRRAMKIAFYNGLTKPSGEVLGIGVICLALLAGGYLVLYQETSLLGIQMTSQPLSFGGLMVFFALLAGVSDPLRKMADVVNFLQKGSAAADRIYPILDRQAKIHSRENALPFNTDFQTIH
ncbi:MAG: ABC transporter transmembrane domain-containing protein, partial [Pirellulaceae bacterium]|nr:ABC transporter transmembrane domain-containing protein [Pirellulaceae bacterium]